MPEELGKIEKPPVEKYKAGRKLYFVPLILSGKDLPGEFMEKVERYWKQVGEQLDNLELKLGKVNRIFHELVPESGEDGKKTIEQLNSDSLKIVQNQAEKGAVLESTEDRDIILELMDWSRCLSIGLQSQKVVSKIYESYIEADKKRNEYISKKLDESLKENESGILFMAEGHHIQFPSDIQIIYVAPPALDEVKRWLRDYEAKSKEQQADQSQSTEDTAETPDKA